MDAHGQDEANGQLLACIARVMTTDTQRALIPFGVEVRVDVSQAVGNVTPFTSTDGVKYHLCYVQPLKPTEQGSLVRERCDVSCRVHYNGMTPIDADELRRRGCTESAAIAALCQHPAVLRRLSGIAGWQV
jgi:hypothetical protein